MVDEEEEDEEEKKNINMQQPLLNKSTGAGNSYRENCPGCQIDLFKETNPGIPYKYLFYVWIVVLCAALPISSLFPFPYFMIRDFHVAKIEEDIGYYAGFVGSAFMFGRALTSIFWGVIADRYGRRPVIIFGMLSLIVFNTLFGLSTSFWMAVSMRFLLGSLCGILGPMRFLNVKFIFTMNLKTDCGVKNINFIYICLNDGSLGLFFPISTWVRHMLQKFAVKNIKLWECQL